MDDSIYLTHIYITPTFNYYFLKYESDKLISYYALLANNFYEINNLQQILASINPYYLQLLILKYYYFNSFILSRPLHFHLKFII